MISIIHYCSKEHPFNGNIFYNFEYFIFMLNHKIDVKLYIVSELVDLDTIINIMEDRYCLKNINYKKYIEFSFYNLKDFIFDVVVTNAKTAMILTNTIKTNEIHINQTWDSYTNNLNKEFFKKYYKKVFLYNENSLCGKVNYTRTMYLDLLKKYEKCDNNMYVHISGIREISLESFIKYILPNRKNRKIIISLPEYQKNQLVLFDKMNFVDSYLNHVPELFKKISTYFYILLDGIDYSPRMLIESFYLNKEIIYINKSKLININDRYKSILNRNIEKYIMNKEDKLIKNILNKNSITT